MVPRRILRPLAGLILAWSCAVLPAPAEAGGLRLGRPGEGSREPRSFFAAVWELLTDPVDVESPDPAPGDSGSEGGMGIDPNGGMR